MYVHIQNTLEVVNKSNIKTFMIRREDIKEREEICSQYY